MVLAFCRQRSWRFDHTWDHSSLCPCWGPCGRHDSRCERSPQRCCWVLEPASWYSPLLFRPSTSTDRRPPPALVQAKLRRIHQTASKMRKIIMFICHLNRMTQYVVLDRKIVLHSLSCCKIILLWNDKINVWRVLRLCMYWPKCIEEFHNKKNPKS